MKARRPEQISALRTLIAAIDNAQAVDVPMEPAAEQTPIAGARHGVGSTEVARRELSGDEIRCIIHTQIDERAVEAARYDGLGEAAAARRLRAEAAVLQALLDEA